jgi:hypothetical protein
LRRLPGAGNADVMTSTTDTADATDTIGITAKPSDDKGPEGLTATARCRALVTELPPTRCTDHGTVDRKGRAVCPAHSRALRIRWCDDDAM